MPLATLKEVLGIATQSKTAIPGFNIDNIEIPEAIITAAEEYHCPVILTIGQGAIQAGQMHHLADVVRRLADEDPVHYDETAARLELKARRAAERKAEQRAHEKNPCVPAGCLPARLRSARPGAE